jgi:hypothetical protein
MFALLCIQLNSANTQGNNTQTCIKLGIFPLDYISGYPCLQQKISFTPAHKTKLIKQSRNRGPPGSIQRGDWSEKL